MFSDWLVAPANVVNWGIQLFVTWGPIPFALAVFVILVVARPHVARALPLHHRRAINQMQWTYHVALSLSLLSLMMTPAVLTYLISAEMISDVAANAMSTMVIMLVGISFLLPFLISIHVWFPRPVHWYPNQSRVLSPRIRLRAWVIVMGIWFLTEGVLIITGVLFRPENASVSAGEVLQTVLYYTVEGFIFLGLSIYIQVRISRRPPIPGVPLALDMERRRCDLNHVQQISTIFLGAGVSRCLQFLSQLQYESAPFWVAAMTFVLCWAVSVSTLLLALVPTWLLMRRLDPAQQLLNRLEQRVLSSKRETDLFSLDNFRKILNWDEDEIITGSTPQMPKPFLLEILSENPTREELTAPGTGSAPEEVLAAYTYMARVADRAGVPLSAEELEGLREIRRAMRELAEHRATLNEGVASNLAQDYTEAAGDSAAGGRWGLGFSFGLGLGGSVPVKSGENTGEVDEMLRSLLGQSEATSVVGLDQQTIAAWEDFDEKKQLIEQQEKEHNELVQWQQESSEAYGYNPYAPYESEGYPGYGDYEAYGYDPYGGYMTPEYPPYGAYPGYAGYGYDAYGNPAYGGEPYYGDPYAGEYYNYDPAFSDPYGYAGYANPWAGGYPGYGMPPDAMGAGANPYAMPGYDYGQGTPEMPGMSGMPGMPGMPGVSGMPGAPDTAGMSVPSLPQLPMGYLEAGKSTSQPSVDAGFMSRESQNRAPSPAAAGAPQVNQHGNVPGGNLGSTNPQGVNWPGNPGMAPGMNWPGNPGAAPAMNTRETPGTTPGTNWPGSPGAMPGMNAGGDPGITSGTNWPGNPVSGNPAPPEPGQYQPSSNQMAANPNAGFYNPNQAAMPGKNQYFPPAPHEPAPAEDPNDIVDPRAVYPLGYAMPPSSGKPAAGAAPSGAPGRAPNGMPSGGSNGMPSGASGGVPGGMRGGAPGGAPGGASGAMPGGQSFRKGMTQNGN